jgi:hypothetical protein
MSIIMTTAIIVTDLFHFLLFYFFIFQAGPDSFSGPLKEIVMRLVVDDDHLVRLRILKKMPIIVRDIPILCTVLTGNIRLMFLDSNWRIRKELAVVMPEILQSMGQDYFSDNFLEDFLSLLKDDVGEVRVACAEALPLMTTPINAPWVHEKLFPGTNFLYVFLHLLSFTVFGILSFIQNYIDFFP